MLGDEIVIEMTRRERLARLVDAILSLNLVPSAKHRIRRGIVHKLIAKELGVTENSRLRTLVNERMEALGFMRIIVQGNRYYKGARLKI